MKRFGFCIKDISSGKPGIPGSGAPENFEALHRCLFSNKTKV
jgi:hypothetical protein